MALRPTRTQAVLAGAVALLWLAGLVWFRPWIAHNDFAIFRIALERELDGHVRVVGAHSRLGVFHPGPLREWVFALPYWLSGRRAAALPATSLVLNVGWSIWILAVARRLRPLAWGSVCVAGLVVLVVALGPDLSSPWNPHLAILPMYLACWATVSVLSRRGTGWVAAICATSFAAQLHASALIVAGGLLVVVLIGLAFQRRSVRSASAVVLGLLLWSGPIVDLRKGADANLVRLGTVGADGESVGFGDAAGHVSRLLWPGTPLRRVTVRPTVEVLAGFHRWWLLLVVLALGALAAHAIWAGRVDGSDGREELGREDVVIQRVSAVVAVTVLTVTVASISLFVEPAYRYLYGPLQAGAVFGLMVVLGMMVAALADRTDIEAIDWSRLAANPVALAAIPVGLAALLVAIPRQDGPSEQREELELEEAVSAALRDRPAWRTVEAIPLDLRGAGGLDAEVLDVALRFGADARSRRSELGLSAPEAVDGVFGVAMSPSRDCLLAQSGVDEIVRGETATGEIFSIFTIEPDSVADRECIAARRG